MDAPMLDIRNLSISFGNGAVQAVRGVSFTLGREKLGIVGESGAGKSMVGRAIMRLSPPAARVTADRMIFRDIDLLAATEAQMTRIRGRRMGLIMQDPKYSLNPVMTVGEQIAETYRLHYPSEPRAAARERALAMLASVRIRDPERVMGLYPHEVSGGMGQRIMIAMMLVAEPELLVADEPTSALDVTVRMDVLALLDELIARRGLGLVFISHDLHLVRHFCDRILIMYAGRVVDALDAADLNEAQHPYTRGLLASMPSISRRRRRLPILDRSGDWAKAAAP